MASKLYILKDKTPVHEPDTVKWARWLEDTNNDKLRQVALDELEDGSYVSTVFIGHDPRHNDPPELFETISVDPNYRYVVGEDEDGEEVFAWGRESSKRYTTWRDALEGHNQVLEIIGNELWQQQTEKRMAMQF